MESEKSECAEILQSRRQLKLLENFFLGKRGMLLISLTNVSHFSSVRIIVNKVFASFDICYHDLPYCAGHKG